MSNKVFKVVKIIDEYKLVINAGIEAGIGANDKFEIYLEGESVIDPYTNENLGTMDYIKATVEVDCLFPKMCICRNTKTRSPIPFITLETTFSNYLAASNPEPDKLNVNIEDISGGFEDIDRKIHVGDNARLV